MFQSHFFDKMCHESDKEPKKCDLRWVLWDYLKLDQSVLVYLADPEMPSYTTYQYYEYQNYALI